MSIGKSIYWFKFPQKLQINSYSHLELSDWKSSF